MLIGLYVYRHGLNWEEIGEEDLHFDPRFGPEPIFVTEDELREYAGTHSQLST